MGNEIKVNPKSKEINVPNKNQCKTHQSRQLIINTKITYHWPTFRSPTKIMAVNTTNSKCHSCNTHTTQYLKNGSFAWKRITNTTYQHFRPLRKPTTCPPTPRIGKSPRRWGSGRKGKLVEFKKKKDWITDWITVQMSGWVLQHQQTTLQFTMNSRFHSKTANMELNKLKKKRSLPRKIVKEVVNF